MTSSPMRRLASSSCWTTGSFPFLEARVDPGQRAIPPLLELEIGTDISCEIASTGSPRNSRRDRLPSSSAPPTSASRRRPRRARLQSRYALLPASPAQPHLHSSHSAFTAPFPNTFYPKSVSRSTGADANKIKVIKRMAYGFRDDAYFFLKIRAAFPGIR